MCGGPNKLTETSVDGAEIIFDGSTENFNITNASKGCKCTVTNKLLIPMNLAISIVDLRLTSYYWSGNETSADCSSAQFSFEGFIQQCVPSATPEQDNFRYSTLDSQWSLTLPAGASREIMLKDIHTNGRNDAPAMVWFEVKGKCLSSTSFFI